MELYEDSVNQKKSKMPIIIGVCISILLILTVLIIYAIIYLQNSITIIKIDGNRNTEIEEILYLEETEEGTQLYMPIIKTAQYLKYEGFKGDYKDKSEDNTKCHITSENETAMFTKDSDVLVKVEKGSENEYIKIDKPVFEKDGELYTTIEGIEKGFNVLFGYDENFKNIEIYSMDYLIQYYTTKLKIEKYSTDFSDKKAILQNMLIIEENGKFGLINVVDGKPILETKYQQIKYLPVTTDFLVKTNDLYGIVAKDSTIKVKTIYDNIGIIDNERILYLVKQNNTFGVINSEGKIIIEPEYKQIGINISKYSQNGVENPYILLDEIIPVQNEEGLWALFNINGKKVTDFKYNNIGCQSTPATNSYPALVIPSYKIIVVSRDKYYNLVTTEGEELISSDILDSVYFKLDTTTEQNKFYMTSNNNTKVINIEQWLTNTRKIKI